MSCALLHTLKASLFTIPTSLPSLFHSEHLILEIDIDRSPFHLTLNHVLSFVLKFSSPLLFLNRLYHFSLPYTTPQYHAHLHTLMAFSVARNTSIHTSTTTDGVVAMPTTVHQLLLEDERRRRRSNSDVEAAGEMGNATTNQPLLIKGGGPNVDLRGRRLQQLMSSVCRDVQQQHNLIDSDEEDDISIMQREIAALEEEQRRAERQRAEEEAVSAAQAGLKRQLLLKKNDLAEELEHERSRLEEEKVLLRSVAAREWEKLEVPPLGEKWSPSHKQRCAAKEIPLYLPLSSNKSHHSRPPSSSMRGGDSASRIVSSASPADCLQDSGSRLPQSRPPSAVAAFGLVAPNGSEGDLGRVVRVGQVVGLTRRPDSSSSSHRLTTASAPRKVYTRPAALRASQLSVLADRPPSGYLPPTSCGYTEPDTLGVCSPVQEFLEVALTSRQLAVGFDHEAIRSGMCTPSSSRAITSSPSSMRRIGGGVGDERRPSQGKLPPLAPLGSSSPSASTRRRLSTSMNAASLDVGNLRAELELLEKEQEVEEAERSAAEAARRKTIVGW